MHKIINYHERWKLFDKFDVLMIEFKRKTNDLMTARRLFNEVGKLWNVQKKKPN
jgi:hypothetical protein